MKFYSFHIGDYLTAARYLTWDEDAAYRRLLDTYYATEKPLPPDLGKVCRLVMATSKRQRAAVSVVLQEFFELTPDGWTNSRADAEICIMRDKLCDQADKDGNESDRMRRYRARRASLFAALREVGIVPPYNVSMKDLVRMAEENCSAPDAPAVTETVSTAAQAVTLHETLVTSPATAIFTNTNTNTNTNTHTTPEQSPGGTGVPDVCVSIVKKMQECGVKDASASDKTLGVLVGKGADVGMFVDAAVLALGQGKGFAYVLGIVKNKMTAAALDGAALAVPGAAVALELVEGTRAWTDEMAKRCGVAPWKENLEGFPVYQQRVKDAVARHGGKPVAATMARQAGAVAC